MNNTRNINSTLDTIDEQIIILLIRRARIVHQMQQAPEMTLSHDREVHQRVNRVSPPDLRDLLVRVYSTMLRHFQRDQEDLNNPVSRDCSRTG